MDTQLQRRVARLSAHLIGTAAPFAALSAAAVAQPTSDTRGTAAAAASGGSRKDYLKWNGWGYADTRFQLNASGAAELTGSRYVFSGAVLPHLRAFMEQVVGLDLARVTPAKERMEALAAPRRNEAFLRAVEGCAEEVAFDERDRLLHGHGHTAQEIYELRYGALPRCPDVVLYPGCHAHCEAIVKAAVEHDVVLIPFGGGTSVSLALRCPEDETRMIVSVDLVRMNRILRVDKKNNVARIEAGAIGQDIQKKLEAEGVTMGHEPDSVEFSTLGGWVSTRASGMKKNIYGNIEDIVVSVRVVTPIGTFEKGCQVPRMSTGPDLHHIVMGSEGTLGIVTEVTVRVRPVPPVRKYGSVVFPDFRKGVAALEEVQRSRIVPASIRLVDNEQFKFGQALKPEVSSVLAAWLDGAKKWYVTKYLGFDVDTMVACTLLFEGSAEEVERQERSVYEICQRHGGIKGGEENGMRGYVLTFMIAYLRDIGFEYGCIAESFETSVPWSNIMPLCDGVKKRVVQSALSCGVERAPFVSCRVTQLYETGVCVYFYFAFMMHGLKDPVATFNHIEHEARDEILKHGGCELCVGSACARHHGVGKLRKEFMVRTIGETGVSALRGIKATIDPTNVFASRNLID